MAKSTKSTGDQGGPAPRLAVADDNIRCRRMIARDDGTSERCSRFTIRLPGGDRDAFCVSHSSTQHAAQVRRRGVVARNASDEAVRERRRQLADELASEPWQTPYEISVVRVALAHAEIAGDLAATDVREVRALLDAAERAMLIDPHRWQIPPI